MGRCRLALAFAAALIACPAASSGGHVHRFSFSQNGVPKEVARPGDVVSSSTAGAGAVTVPQPLRAGPAGLQIQRATPVGQITIRHADQLRGARVEVDLRVVGATLAAFGDGTRLLTLRVRVAGSTDRDCRAGAAGTLDLVYGPGGGDFARLYLCPTGHEHFFDRVRGRIQVVIR